MQQQRYNVVYAGAIGNGFEEEAVKTNFVVHLKIPENRVEQLFSGKRMTLKKALTKDDAERWQEKLLKIGAETAVVPFVDPQIGRTTKPNINASQIKAEVIAKSPLENKQTKPATSTTSSRAEYDAQMQANIRSAKAAIVTHQIEQQVSKGKEPNTMKKLLVFCGLLAGVMLVLYFYADSLI